MKVVFSWLREFCQTDLSSEAVAEGLTSVGAEVEEIIRPWEGLSGVVTAKVLEVRDHPGSDKLCLARVSFGSGEPGVRGGSATCAAIHHKLYVTGMYKSPCGRSQNAASRGVAHEHKLNPIHQTLASSAGSSNVGGAWAQRSPHEGQGEALCFQRLRDVLAQAVPQQRHQCLCPRINSQSLLPKCERRTVAQKRTWRQLM